MQKSLRSHTLRLILVLFVLALAPLAAYAQNENAETRYICNGLDPVPNGYIKTDIVEMNIDSRCMNPPGSHNPNIAVIRRFYTKPTGYTMTVCASPNVSPLPLGWSNQGSPFFNGFNYCGQTNSSFTLNARVIRRDSTSSIDDASAFVYYHYMDFLAREPDQSGWNWWTSQITQCGSNQGCIDAQRVNVSKAFFESIEFQNSGFFAYRIYKAAFGRFIRFGEFLIDTDTLTNGVVVGTAGWEDRMNNNKLNYCFAFVNRQDYRDIFQSMTNEQFVDRLFQNAGYTDFTERQRLLTMLNSNARYVVLKSFVENQTFHDREYNSNFVRSSYFGYLRRDPDEPGFNGWLNSLNSSGAYPNSNYFENISAFIHSDEYRNRFDQ